MSKVVIVVLAVTGAIIALNYAIKAAIVLQTAFNLVMSLNPIGLVVLAIAALVAGLVIAYKKFDVFKDLVDGLFGILKTLGGFIKNFLLGYFDAWLTIIDKIRDGIKAIADSSIGKALGGLISRVTGQRAAGGSVSAGKPYRVGEFGSEIFVPNGSGSIRPDKGGGGNTFILNGIVDAESARRSIERVMQSSTRRTGAVNLAGSPL